MGAGETKENKVVSFLKRRASPLIFKLIKTGTSNYFPIILLLNGELIPSNYEIMDKDGNNQSSANIRVVEEFLDTVRQKPHLEISL